ncbi:NADP-dependent alcohol dehydrogenase C 1 [Diplonema papillatum]|nr:NADP-dependent alcohol dehydrogenase C 1 [Diplonema papillatum]|eukprot:gene9239-14320_t
MMRKTIGYAAKSAGALLEPCELDRRALRDNDVALQVTYCGVCHSDLHQVRNDWGTAKFPMIPGHEIVGKVLDVGPRVSRFKRGDSVAVGCMVDSCKACDQCHKGEEQFCREGMVATYNGRDRTSGEVTLGGYSKMKVVRDDFVLSVPPGLDLSRAAPLLCAGITTYSPLREWGVGVGSRVGVVGLGGLGHMGVKIASAMGAHVTVVSTSPGKEEEAFGLGADAFLLSTDAAAVEKAVGSFELILDTVPVQHDLNAYLPMLDVDGTIVLVGQLGPMGELGSAPLVRGRKRVAGSFIGGVKQTQELLDFCARKNVLPECEIIRMDQINEAFVRMEKSDVRYRFVIDMSTLDSI